MRALTIHQPWPYLMLVDPCVTGEMNVERKRVENRTRRPPASLAPTREGPGEPFAIHASAKPDRAAIEDLERRGYILPGAWPLAVDVPIGERSSACCGAVLGVARVERVVEQDRWEARLPGGQLRWWIGPCGWLLCDVVALPTPVPCKGQQGHGWRLSEDVEEMVVEGWGKA